MTRDALRKLILKCNQYNDIQALHHFAQGFTHSATIIIPRLLCCVVFSRILQASWTMVLVTFQGLIRRRILLVTL